MYSPLTDEQKRKLQDAYLIEMVSSKFSEFIRCWLTIEEVGEVNDKNETEEYKNACATHDYCDANIAMADAFTEITNSTDYFTDMAIDLMNKAWTRSREAKFQN
jgi:hypothetical protein